MSKISIDTVELLEQLNTISSSLKTLNSIARGMQILPKANNEYNLTPLIRYRDISQSIGASIESYVQCTERDINAMMEQVGILEQVDKDNAKAFDKKITFKP